MADVVVKFQGETVIETSESNSIIVETNGTYCEGDITVVYTKEEPTSLIVDVDGSTMGTTWVTICQHELLKQHRDELKLLWFFNDNPSKTTTATTAYVLGGVASSQPMYSLSDGNTRCQLTDVYNSAKTGVTNVDRSVSLANSETGTTTHVMKVTTDGKLQRYVTSGTKFAPGMYRFIFTW